MTKMELFHGGDNLTPSILPATGNAKIVLLNADGQLFAHKISNGFSDEKIYLHVNSSSDDDDDHEENTDKVNLSSDSGIDTQVKISKIEIGDSQCTPAKANVVDGDSTETQNVNDDESMVSVVSKMNGDEVQIFVPSNSQLPKPEAPPGVTINGTKSLSEYIEDDDDDDVPSIGKFFREKRNSLASAITRRLSSLTDNNEGTGSDELDLNNVTEFNLSGLKVIVNSKSEEEDDHRGNMEFKGRISFFSKSNCRDCRAVRSFFREKNLRYVEINIDVFPMREKELKERIGSSSVPQIFLNEKLFGGLVALNSLRNSGMLEEKLKELLCERCPDTAPAVPVYGFDDPEVERMDETVGIVWVLRQRLPIQDRLMKMKIVKNCFSGAEMVDEIMKHYAGCNRAEAVDIGKQIVRKHFVHHVFGENDFEDGNHYYRFLEHESFIPRCFNFRGSTNDSEPKSAATLGQRLTKLMCAILESYASDDRQHLNYTAISSSEEFRRYLTLVQDLHRVNLLSLSEDEKLAFFLNLFNAMVIHAVITVGHPASVVDRRYFNSDFLYVIGGHPYSLTAIRNGILRSNRRAPYSLVKPFGVGDKCLELALPKVNPLIHFGLCSGTRSSPVVRFFTPQGVESELRYATREFFQKDGMEVDLAKRTVYLTRIINWFSVDFGQEREILQWILKYLDATRAGLLTHLLGDGGPVNIVYKDYDWSVNC